MDRLKVLGRWVLLVIAFYIFSNILIHIALNNGSVKPIKYVNVKIGNEYVRIKDK